MHAVVNLSNIEIIDHKYLESGHTQMECDSMHPAFEFASFDFHPIYFNAFRIYLAVLEC
jgi:hypothetical protein